MSKIRTLFRCGVPTLLIVALWGGVAVAAAPQRAAKPIYECKFAGPVGGKPDRHQWFYDRGWDPNCPTYYADDKQSLHIVASKGAKGGRALAICVRPYPGKPGAYISGRINTHIDPKGRLEYGFYEARIKIPGGPSGAGSGAWPAFWLLGANFPKVGWPQCGEIDIMEYSGNRPQQVTGTIHGPDGVGGGGAYFLAKGRTFWKKYHTFGCYWSPGSIRFECDGHVYAAFTPLDQNRGGWVFNHRFYIILNLAEGGAYGGTTRATAKFPQTMLVDWIKVFAWKIHTPAMAAPVACGKGKVLVSWSDSAFDQTGFEVERSGSATFSTINEKRQLPANITDFVDRGLGTGQRWFYRLRATGGGQKSAWTRPVAITTLAVGQKPKSGWVLFQGGKVVRAINVGGLAHGGFSADQDCLNTSGEMKTGPVNMTQIPAGIPEKIFQSNRFGNFTYRLAGFKPRGRYLVELFFAENYWKKAGKRLFAVFINKRQVLNDFDIYAAAGGANRAVERAFTARASADGHLVLRLASQRDNALLDGICVLRAR
nr:endo-1,3-beta-D-glucosidase [uncultured bacterium]